VTVNKKRYSEKFKKRMIQRLVGPQKMSAHTLSKEIGVCQPTLSLWLRKAGRVAVVDDKTKPRVRRPEDWTPKEKLEAVLAAERMTDGDLGLWLRRMGLKEQHLREWRAALAERASAVFEPREPRLSAESRKRVKELERELVRKDKALAETAALLVLQGKMEALWAAEDDATRQGSDAPSSRASHKRKPQGRG
jgi:transposase-like protein